MKTPKKIPSINKLSSTFKEGIKNGIESVKDSKIISDTQKSARSLFMVSSLALGSIGLTGCGGGGGSSTPSSIDINTTDINKTNPELSTNLQPKIDGIKSIKLSTNTPYFNQLDIKDSDGFISDILISGHPSWLSLDKTTYQVSGTPTESGTFTYTITAIDNQGLQTIQKFTINVAPTEVVETNTTVTPTVETNTTVTPTEVVTENKEITVIDKDFNFNMVGKPGYEADGRFKAYFTGNPGDAVYFNGQTYDGYFVDDEGKFSSDFPPDYIANAPTGYLYNEVSLKDKNGNMSKTFAYEVVIEADDNGKNTITSVTYKILD